MTTSDRYQRIYEVVRRVPRGRVATYGQVAALAGLAGHARQVGYALHALDEDHDLPWQRVINARGEVSPRSEPGWEGLQRRMLEDEGVRFDDRGRVDLDRYRWEPEGPVSRPASGRGNRGSRRGR
jgi:methylated-DNA-protein-cysteine methyltransferase-like protein